jgi:hypothetical protein
MAEGMKMIIDSKDFPPRFGKRVDLTEWIPEPPLEMESRQQETYE